jgi:hypothetical protein
VDSRLPRPAAASVTAWLGAFGSDRLGDRASFGARKRAVRLRGSRRMGL